MGGTVTNVNPTQAASPNTFNSGHEVSSNTVSQAARSGIAPVKRKLRVVHIVHKDGPGGGPISINRIVTYFHRVQDITVLAGGQGKVSQHCELLQVPFCKVPLETKLKALFLGLPLLVWHLLRIKPDVVVVHGQWAGPVGAIAARIARVPKVVYVARWPSFYTSWDLFRVVRNHFSERVPCRLSDRTVTLSESNYYQYLLRQHAPEDRLMMIPNSISKNDLPTPDQVEFFRTKCGFSSANCNVVSVGRLTDQKRVMWLVQSWKTVIAECPHAKLWIIGDGPRLPLLKELAAELKLGESCVFLGEQDGLAAIGASDIVAMTSVYESRGNVAMEAMLCGKPIVASNVDGICDTIHHNVDGFLVQPGYTKQFAERLIDLIKDPALRQRMGSAGEQLIAEYDVPLIMKHYETLFAELAPKN